jgi:hypothetical protein
MNSLNFKPTLSIRRVKNNPNAHIPFHSPILTWHRSANGLYQKGGVRCVFLVRRPAILNRFGVLLLGSSGKIQLSLALILSPPVVNCQEPRYVCWFGFVREFRFWTPVCGIPVLSLAIFGHIHDGVMWELELSSSGSLVSLFVGWKNSCPISVNFC